MNEKLAVKNFGPIVGAELDLRKVTVFIGPTGGGKSTLAKLLAIFRDFSVIGEDKMDLEKIEQQIINALRNFGIQNFKNDTTELNWINSKGINLSFSDSNLNKNAKIKSGINNILIEDLKTKIKDSFLSQPDIFKEKITKELNNLHNDKIIDDVIYKSALSEDMKDKFFETTIEIAIDLFSKKAIQFTFAPKQPQYIPAERIFASTISDALAGLNLNDIALPKTLLNFSNQFALARKDIQQQQIPFFNVTYHHHEGKDEIEIENKRIELSESASGIQAVLPMMLVIKHLFNKEEPQSFIIEEPEQNLYPAAQFALLNFLVQHCAHDKNDLTLTTHSPYILAHLNLLLYAYQVGNKNPEQAEKVAKIVPREAWINPEEFNAYYVGEGSVRSLVDRKTGLIDRNALDDISGVNADEFDVLMDIKRGF